MEELLMQIIGKLDKLESETKEGFEKVNAKLAEHDEEFEKIKAKLAEHDNKFDEIDVKFESVFDILKRHDKEFEKLNSKFDAEIKDISDNFKLVYEKLADHDKQFEMLNGKLTEHDIEFNNIKSYLFMLENKISIEIPALFEGYSSNKEKNGELEERQNAIERKVELDSLRISVLEESSKTYSEQLSKLQKK